MAVDRGFDRRELLRRGAALGLGAGLAPLAAVAAEPAPREPAVRRRVALGDTGLRIADVSFGSSRLSGDEALVRHALDRGIDYFDTAESYARSESEKTLGRALGGDRQRVLLASKTKCGTRTTRSELFDALEGSLRRLRTDVIDVYFNHAVNAPDRLLNPEWNEFAERAREQGKIRFTGMSGHGGRLVPCLELAARERLVDVVLVGYNYGQDPAFYERFTSRFDFVAVQPKLPEALARVHEAGIGVIAMKTLRGARLNDLRPYEADGATFGQAALRWALSSRHVDAAIISMKSQEQVDEYLGASGWTGPAPQDAGLLLRHARRSASTQCRYGCDACLSACPAGVEIPEVLRTRMYLEDYEDEELAREDYARIGRDAGPCLGCAHRACTGACPHGVDIPELTTRAARRLG